VIDPTRDKRTTTDDVERFRRADAIFDAALDLEPAARGEYVESACAGDGALRDSVERLLRAHERAADFLAEPAAHVAVPSFTSGPGAWPSEADEDALRSRIQRALGEGYRVESCIGRGGMAIVYRAHDLRHDRPVAVKVLDPELGAAIGADRAARFLAEIRMTARLQHPNVVPLFDSGSNEGLLYYVMPFVEGETLRHRLQRESPLPVDDALRIALGVAHALEHAHDHGIVHRDLKPENILLQAGQPVVADFGIALAVSHAGAANVTGPGVHLGTPQYMSPEQFSKNDSVDRRTDIYSLGAVLYEMLTGDPPHAAASAHAVLAKRRAERPTPVRVIRERVPERVASTVERALELLPTDRFSSVREFADALSSGIGETGYSAAPRQKSPVRSARRWRRWGVAVGALAATAAVMLWMRRQDQKPSPSAPSTFIVTPPEGADSRSATITPDGSRLVYTGSEAMQRRLLVRRLRELTAQPLAGTDGATSAFISPDGRWIGFFTTDEQLKKVPIDGGPVTVLSGAFRYAWGTWGAGDRIVFSPRHGNPGLAWMPASGGAPRPLTRYDSTRNETRHSAPVMLDDGRTVLFTAERNRHGPVPPDGELAVATLDLNAVTPGPHALIGVHGQSALAVVDDWLLYVASGGTTLMAVRFDRARRHVAGSPVPIANVPGGGMTSPHLARNGTLLYARNIRRNTPVMVDATGAWRPMFDGVSGAFMNPRVSPDGRQLVIQRAQPRQGTDAWIFDMVSKTRTQLTTLGTALGPTWSPDGQRIVFLSQANGRTEFRWQFTRKAAPAERIVEGPGLFAVDVAPDGRTIVFQRQLDSVLGIWSAQIGANVRPRPVVVERFNAFMPALSPDGRWLAYAANASGQYEIYVRPFPGPGAPVQVSDSGGTEPAWSRDGRRLYFRATRRMMAVTLVTRPALAIIKRATLFTGAFDDDDMPMPHRNYDVMPDGQHFVMIGTAPDAVHETVVALGWMDQVRGQLARRH
jgi:serine/threonine-protein kinase